MDKHDGLHLPAVLLLLVGSALVIADLLLSYGLLASVSEQVSAILTAAGGVCLLLGGLLLLRLWRQAQQEGDDLSEQLAREKQLYQTQVDAIQTADREERETFRSMLSHGLRMPVAVIQGYAELLAGGQVTDGETRREYIEKILQRSQSLTDFLARQLSTRKLVEEEDLRYERLDLLELAVRIAGDMRSYAAEREISLQVLSSESSLEAEADAGVLDRVLYNILENAVKYMGRPGNVTVRVQRQGDSARISVQDDGMGMPENEVEHIFELHYQGSNHVEGQGHGLYLARQAVEAHGGTISARSRPGSGMGIFILLPLHRSREAMHMDGQTA